MCLKRFTLIAALVSLAFPAASAQAGGPGIRIGVGFGVPYYPRPYYSRTGECMYRRFEWVFMSVPRPMWRPPPYYYYPGPAPVYVQPAPVATYPPPAPYAQSPAPTQLNIPPTSVPTSPPPAPIPVQPQSR